jgi:beta-catenin-like protein 1
VTRSSRSSYNHRPLVVALLREQGGEGKRKKLGATSSFEDEEHLLGILVSLFTNLASDTPARIRLIAKFIEADYEKVDRLLEMREVAETKLRAVNREITAERRVSSLAPQMCR